MLNSPEEIYLGATIYFQNFLVDNSNFEHADLFHMLESVVSEEENSALCHPRSMEEVKDTIFSILRYNAQRSDGFGSKFYMVGWKVIKEDVLEVVQDFFKGSLLPRFYTSFYIVLIPRVKDPKIFDKFRPSVFARLLLSGLQNLLKTPGEAHDQAFVSNDLSKARHFHSE